MSALAFGLVLVAAGCLVFAVSQRMEWGRVGLRDLRSSASVVRFDIPKGMGST